MARRKDEPQAKTPRRRPATTPEARENQLIGLAVDLAERQLLDGSASSQVISHFLKLASSRERLEQERLRGENHLLAVKAEAIESQKKIEVLYADALKAMSSYSGREPAAEGNEDD